MVFGSIVPAAILLSPSIITLVKLKVPCLEVCSHPIFYFWIFNRTAGYYFLQAMMPFVQKTNAKFYTDRRMNL
nr:MAG TPA: hypothetical protein [Caudoviricetes sp.]